MTFISTEDAVKHLPLLFILFSLFNSVHAQNLCDASCEFSATFPEGGSLEAIDELTLTFGTGGELILGTGGTVNTAIQPSSLDFLSGGTLTLSAGESITFGPGGSLVLGTGGNIDALNYNLVTTGDISIGATGGRQMINIYGDLDVSGILNFVSPFLKINSTITTGTELNLTNSTIIAGTGSIEVAEATTVTVDSLEIIPPGALTFDLNNEPIIAAEFITLPGNYSPLLSLDGLNGLELPTDDGSNCIVESPECISDDGTVYVLSDDSKLVKKEAPSDTSAGGKSGSIDLPFLGFFMILLVLSGPRKTLTR